MDDHGHINTKAEVEAEIAFERLKGIVHLLL